MKDTNIITLGCRLNTLESEVMRDEMAKAGVTDAVIINTCAVTAEAERQARQTIRRIKRERPTARIIVTGCAAQLDPAKFASMAEVDRVVGNAEKLNGAQLLGFGQNDPSSIVVSDIQEVKETAGHLVSGLDGRTRAFVMVQQGCDNDCTFCIIPAARGPNRSVPLDAIVAQVHKLVAAGHLEVVLTGVDIAAYGSDLGLCDDHGTGLTTIVRAILAGVPDLARLRLSSLDPARLNDGFFELLKTEPRLMPHLHLSLQAGEDLVLKRMKRRHSIADIRLIVERALSARPGLVFGADLIAGFPTESETMFETTVRNVQDLGLHYLHVFPYSSRPGTPAERMPQVPGDVAKARAKRLREVGDANLARHLETLRGTTQTVLVEKADFARTETFAPVRLTTPATPGNLIQVTITGHQDGELLAASSSVQAAE
ncbi:tRNA (N(6)-L-threonylcarbamoyladenosine(37)-C(2))-methylthiotransferase MtaB [Magnetovibrio blakemorei]|uniref:tRNA (N(6)-L-threonylcarbamoyladenosine(37)-C(2))-methylthiotransferase MtaB n=1 Tax=Magnetovibrio blakemorei TaxID=28181 RepID=A0A1E5QAZ5_9PROT|nr:tRNA (N(6)-L-threonylcarbamoyladenosine(37)-C(2))-methylthiotransferase MtaB [Magnetovibrio blakemorei]OEJ69179.1 tRNA (N(6)-L-threonylcarbamoyladenosine(37)-C(2))-methylthiotransferase MtaB [Magnetovibrio blakemorei]